jgi:hypothetical protein
MADRKGSDVVQIDGAKRFDFTKVLSAYQRLIDALAAAFGEAQVVMPGRTAPRHYPWTLDGKRRAMEFWMQASAVADSSDDRLWHPAGLVTAQAYLLGNAGLVGDWQFHVAAPSDGGEVSSLANEPVVRVYGPIITEFSGMPVCALPSADQLARVGVLMEEAVPDLGLSLSLSEPFRKPGGIDERYAIITFPHEVYGDGRGRIRVRMRAIRPGDSKCSLN